MIRPIATWHNLAQPWTLEQMLRRLSFQEAYALMRDHRITREMFEEYRRIWRGSATRWGSN